MELIQFKSSGRDQFGRKYPVKIQFKDEKVVYGQIISFLQQPPNENGEIVTTNILLKVIKNIDDWVENKTEVYAERMFFDDNIIDTIMTFDSY